MERKTMIAVAGVAVLTGGGGLLLGRTLSGVPDTPPASSPPMTAAPVEPQFVAMTPARVAAAGIEIVRPETGKIAVEIVAQGVVSSSVGAEAVLAAGANGRVVRLLKRLGDPVRNGETVALIESQEASAIASEQATATAQRELARTRYTRERQLYEARVSARQDMETAGAELAAAEAEARRAAAAASAARVTGDGRTVGVVSPVGGRISAAPAALGTFVAAGAELYRVIDPSRIEIRAAVPAAEAGRVSVGAPAVLEIAPGVTGTAIVRSVAPDVDLVSRAATVVLTPTGAGASVNPGQAVSVRITARGAAGRGALTVPLEAVQLVDGREVVFVRTETGFRPQPVAVGARTGDRAEITSGLSADTLIAGGNAFLVKAELGRGSEEEAAQ